TCALPISVRELDIALVGDDAAPDIAWIAGRGRARVAQPGVGELSILDRVADNVEGEWTIAGLPLGAAGEGGHQEPVRRVASGQSEMREGQLHLSADAGGILLRGRGGCRVGQGSKGLRNLQQGGFAGND